MRKNNNNNNGFPPHLLNVLVKKEIKDANIIRRYKKERVDNDDKKLDNDNND